MGLPTCLISRHQHIAALSAMGVAPENPTFPAVVICPLCQHPTLYLFDDAVTSGIWLHCRQCLSHGDIITFAAKIWNTSPADAAETLIGQGLLPREKFEAAEADYSAALKINAAAEKFWADAAAQIWTHEDDLMTVRLRDLGARQEINIAALVGVATIKQVYSLCHLLRRAKPQALRRDSTFLVMPYFDMPGRLTGFLLTQYGVNNAENAIFLPIGTIRGMRPEAGYFLLDAALSKHNDTLKNTQFIVDDPYWALCMQFKQLQNYEELLPVAASHVSATATNYGRNWTNLSPGSTRLFQSRFISPELISHACGGQGYVCLTTHKTKRRKRVFAHLADMKRQAQTWQTALHTALTGAADAAAYAFVSRLTIPHEKLQLFFNRHAESFSKPFVERALFAVKNPTTARINSRNVVVERQHDWVNQYGKSICSARIVIDKIYYVNGKDKLYGGTIYLHDGQVTFLEHAKKIEKTGLLAYAAATVAPAGKLILFDRLWNPRAHLVAMQLHAPEIVNISSALGWDTNADVFRFGNYHLTTAGAVEPTPHLPNQNQRLIFPEPEITAPVTLRALLPDTPENTFVWSVFAGIATNLIAPIIGAEQFAVAIPNKTVLLAAQIAAATNCEIRRHVGLHGDKAVRIFDSDNWPVCISNEFDEMAFGKILPRYHNRPLVVGLSNTATYAAPGYGWLAITGQPITRAIDVTVLKHVLPSYIQHVLRNRMAIAARPGERFLTVLADIQNWLMTAYGAAFNLDFAAQQVYLPSRAHEAIMRELAQAIDNGAIDILPRPRRKDQPTNYILRWRDNYWLNRRAIDRYFNDGKTTPPNWAKIIELLAQIGVFAGEEKIHNMPGVLVNTTWVDQYLWADRDTSQRAIG